MSSDRRKSLQDALQQIEKSFGKGAIMRMGDGSAREAVRVLPTGCLSLDIALGVGGIPRGRVVEVFGPESSGKTTLTLQLIAQCQRAGGTCAFIDAEHALDLGYASRLGVDVGALLVSQPDTGEQALEIVDLLARSGAVDLVVVDSVAALTPQAELEGAMGDAHVGLQARLMSQALRKLTAFVYQSNSIVVFINQIRMKIGVSFGNPETTTGGNALKFYSSVRMDIRRIGAIKQKEDVIGNRTRVKIVKNKVAPPFREVEFDIYYGTGICPFADLVDLAEGAGLLTKSGSWYACGDERIGQGREQARQYLADHPEVVDRIRRQLRDRAGLPAEAAPPPAKADPPNGKVAPSGPAARPAALTESAHA
ncbi:recombinase RecA [Myxococcota bacterium]|nr:recombinase RecA [Myxococcota bacterium]